MRSQRTNEKAKAPTGRVTQFHSGVRITRDCLALSKRNWLGEREDWVKAKVSGQEDEGVSKGNKSRILKLIENDVSPRDFIVYLFVVREFVCMRFYVCVCLHVCGHDLKLMLDVFLNDSSLYLSTRRAC